MYMEFQFWGHVLYILGLKPQEVIIVPFNTNLSILSRLIDL